MIKKQITSFQLKLFIGIFIIIVIILYILVLLLQPKRYYMWYPTIPFYPNNDKEIDFIAEKNNKKIYIQVSVSLQSEAVINKEYGNLESVYDAHEKWVISLDDTISGNRNGIQHVYPWEL